jgi:predicted transcriptional regulator
VGKKRGRLAIIAAILEATNSVNCKTRIMLQANLNFDLIEKYLNIIVKIGLIQVNDQKYELTKAGQDFLKRYKHLHERYINAKDFLKTLDYEYQQLEMSVSKP